MFCQITGLGVSVPENTVSNFDLEKIMDTSDEWISTRTGIKNRRILRDDENISE
ncbi:MAG: 3-oxoacyl-ACP synthase, partial [Mailhella sp.]|nr:3-oxoacyl-ACP synthase [Mailhella sp.]